MTKVAGPCMSLDASGQLGGALVFSKWKGRPYVRQLVKPSNPKTGGQVGMRAMFKFLSQIWSAMSAGDKATWEGRAADKVVSPFNAFVSHGQFTWRDFLPPGLVDPYTQSGNPSLLTNEAAVAGERSITYSVDTGTGANQWGIAIFRSTSTGFSPAWDNCIAVVTAEPSDTITYVDSPLDPGTYYYDSRPFTGDNMWGVLAGEVSATVN